MNWLTIKQHVDSINAISDLRVISAACYQVLQSAIPLTAGMSDSVGVMKLSDPKIAAGNTCRSPFTSVLWSHNQSLRKTRRLFNKADNNGGPAGLMFLQVDSKKITGTWDQLRLDYINLSPGNSVKSQCILVFNCRYNSFFKSC